MKKLALLVLATQLQGCFFFMVPTQGMSNMAYGAYCMGPDVYAGQRFNIRGKDMVVTSITGPDSACAVPAHPIRVKAQEV